jgi:Iron-sulfur cluster assembly protein
MSNDYEVALKRDCEAIQIPAGLKTTLPAGTQVIITQSLGGSYTIACDYGLFRIAEKNADALGLEPRSAQEKDRKNADEVDEEEVWEQLRTVYDPEIPVNIVDLGLVYSTGMRHGPGNRAGCKIKNPCDSGRRRSGRRIGMGPSMEPAHDQRSWKDEAGAHLTEFRKQFSGVRMGDLKRPD